MRKSRTVLLKLKEDLIGFIEPNNSYNRINCVGFQEDIEKVVALAV